MRRSRVRVWRGFMAGVAAIAMIAGSVLVSATPASAAPLTMNVTRFNSGGSAHPTITVDPVGSCSTQVPGDTAHCPGFDTTYAAEDQILRTYDAATVSFSFDVGSSDTGVTIRSTLPASGSTALAVWLAVPSACAASSAITDGGRTLTCVVGSLSGNGLVQAAVQPQPAAQDGYTFTVEGSISSNSSTAVTATSTATFTVSNAPFYDVKKNNFGNQANTLGAPFPYYSATGELGWAVPTSTGVWANRRAGAFSQLQAPVTWTEETAQLPAGARLLSWGEYGSGCGSYNTASTTVDPGYTNAAVAVTNQLFPPSATIDCTQSVPNQPIQMSWTNPPTKPFGFVGQPGGLQGNVWVMLWIPATSLTQPVTTFNVTASNLQATDVFGVQNYGGQQPPATDHSRSVTINVADNRTYAKNIVSDASTNRSRPGGALTSTKRGETWQASLEFTNNGAVPQSPVQVCDAFDSTASRLTPFANGDFAVAVTEGNPELEALPPAYAPSASYTPDVDERIASSAYTVEYAIGVEESTGTVPAAPQSAESLTAADCADGGTATGWHSSPDAAALDAYAEGLGVADPLDLVNRVRVTFAADAVMPGSHVGVKLRFTTRTTFRDASTRAGQIVPATTPIVDKMSFGYPQSTVGSWTEAKAPIAAFRVAGFLGANVSIAAKTASVPRVQVATPGQDTVTYTITPRISLGEDLPPDPATPGNVLAPVRVVDYLPTGMRYLQGSASLEPDHVLAQPDGSTVIVWDLGTQSAPVNAPNRPTSPATLSYQASADPLADLKTNYNGVLAESIAPDGTLIDPRGTMPNCTTTPVQFTIPPTPHVDVPTTAAFPTPRELGGCAGQGTLGRYNFVGVEIGSAAVQLVGSKTAMTPRIQPGDADGVNGDDVGWTMSYSNRTSIPLPGVDIIDVLPHNGDGRTPASEFSGAMRLTNIETDDALSPAGSPNALPTNANGPYPSRTGTTFYFTSLASASVQGDPYDASNLQGGTTTWCLESQFGTAGCPATMQDATAVRIISGAIDPAEQLNLRLGFATEGNADGDRYSNSATGRAIGLTSPAFIPGDTIVVVASSISGSVWDDANGDGAIAAGESPLEDVTLNLTGATSDGVPVTRTVTTGADGGYVFGDLPAGSYDVAVDQASVRALDAAYAVTADPDDDTASPDGTFHVDLGLNVDEVTNNVGFATQSLSGFVYDDLDNDGAFDSGEDPRDGITVTLTGTDDLGAAVARTAETDADGAYTFDGLRPGTYQLVKTQKTDRVGGKSTAGSAGGIAGAPGTNTISEIVLTASEDGASYLFGELPSRIVSGLVFADLDGDGVQDAGESGIAGVTVTITGTDDNGAVERDALTLADGTFTFTGLRSGTYTLTEHQPLGYLQGTTTAPAGGGSVDGDTVTGIDLTGTQIRAGYTFGEEPPGSIAGSVFHDVNANGSRDAGEPGIASVEVELSGPTDTVPVMTDDNGDYAFSGLAEGEYTVRADEAAGYLDGFEVAGSAGGDVGESSASDAITGVQLAVGQAATGYLFGDVQAASIAGAVFVDADDDGGQGPLETGIGGANISVTGTDLFGTAVSRTATTLADGSYLVGDLLPGTYTVTESQPAGYFDGKDTAGSQGGTVGADTVSGIVLASGATAVGYLFGERAGTSVRGAVFRDLDGDGVRDAAEGGIAGVTITLRDDSDNEVASTISGDDGAWSFTDVAPGTYSIVEEDQPLTDYVDGSTTAGTGGGATAPNRVDGVVLDGAEDGYLFAEIPLSAIRGAVWHDADDDGVQEAGEAPIPGVEITLSGSADRTTVTNADGSFVFAGLAAGTYAITEQDLDNWADGRTRVGTAGGTPATNSVSGIVLGAGQDAAGYGFAERAAELQIIVSTQTADAQTPTGPFVAVGDAVRWTYRIVNHGDTSLDAITVTDSEEGPAVCAETTLAPHSEMTCALDGIATAGQHENTGTVTAQVVPAGDGPGIRDVTELTASDVSHYFGAVIDAEIAAQVDDQTAGVAPGPVFAEGTEVTVRLTIRNTGNVPLVVESLATGALGTLDCGASARIPVDGAVECVLTWTPPPGNHMFPVSALLAGPGLTGVDGTLTSSSAEPETTVFFQVLEAGVPLPSEMAPTGGSVDGRLIAGLVVALLIGTLLVVVTRRRRLIEAD